MRWMSMRIPGGAGSESGQAVEVCGIDDAA
jgi:hypothetical protein